MTLLVPPRADAGSSIQTIERGMQVLRAFRSHRRPLTNAELVRRTGLPKATVSRLTSTLLELGFIRHIPGSRAFEIAPGALSIGNAMLGACELPQAVDPFLRELADTLGVSVALSVPDGLEMLYVAYRAGPQVVSLRMDVGTLIPMGTTASGHAHLWSLPPGQREALVEEMRRAHDPRRGYVEAALTESFAQLQEQGTCAVLGQYQRGVYGIALPVRLGLGQVLMSLSCGKAEMSPDLVSERRRIAPFLKDVAGRLQRSVAGLDSASWA